jgi:precorrin-3B methylase
MIEKRLHAAASADFVICLYNPRSKGRPNHFNTTVVISTKVSSISPIEVKIACSFLRPTSLANPMIVSFGLSDLMTPWTMIEKRLHAAASADFVICLYNPRSKGSASSTGSNSRNHFDCKLFIHLTDKF